MTKETDLLKTRSSSVLVKEETLVGFTVSIRWISSEGSDKTRETSRRDSVPEQIKGRNVNNL